MVLLGVKCWDGAGEEPQDVGEKRREEDSGGSSNCRYLIKSLILNPFKSEGWKGRCVRVLSWYLNALSTNQGVCYRFPFQLIAVR